LPHHDACLGISFVQVQDGPPVQIGWTPEKENVLAINVYEVFRPRRRDRTDLFLSTDERTETLLLQGYSEDEIHAASTECARVKYERCLSAGLIEMKDHEDGEVLLLQKR
jgi:hypothetical protein